MSISFNIIQNINIDTCKHDVNVAVELTGTSLTSETKKLRTHAVMHRTYGFRGEKKLSKTVTLIPSLNKVNVR